MENLAVACKQSSGTFTFPERDAVMRFAITKFWQQISILKQQRDKELRMNNRNIEILNQLWKKNTHKQTWNRRVYSKQLYYGNITNGIKISYVPCKFGWSETITWFLRPEN